MFCPLFVRAVQAMSEAPMIESQHWLEEKIEPYEERCNPDWALSVGTQWKLICAAWVVILAWVITWAFDLFPVGSPMWWWNEVVPCFLLFVCGLPVAISMLGYNPPRTGWISLVVNLAAPWYSIWQGIGIPFFIGYVSTGIVVFFYFAMVTSKMTNTADTFDYPWFIGVPPLLGLINGWFYLWQFSTHVPLNWKLRWIILWYKYAKECLEQVKECRKKTPYNPEQWRVYKLNDVQYIRLFTVRVIIFIFMTTVMRKLEETLCPAQEYEVNGWLPYINDFSYNKTLPMCEW